MWSSFAPSSTSSQWLPVASTSDHSLFARLCAHCFFWLFFSCFRLVNGCLSIHVVLLCTIFNFLAVVASSFHDLFGRLCNLCSFCILISCFKLVCGCLWDIHMLLLCTFFNFV